MARVTFRPYRRDDFPDCLRLFDANCPAYFAQNERAEYETFLDAEPAGYEVCEVDNRLLGGFGAFDTHDGERTIRWILLSPDVQGMGIGTRVMDRILRQSRATDASLVRIATSPKAAAFFAQFGAVARRAVKDGWGPGMDRVDMELPLRDPSPLLVDSHQVGED